MTEKEHLERWLAELQEEEKNHSTQLEIYRLNEAGLEVKRRLMQQLAFEYGDVASFNEHLGFNEVKSELAELQSEAQQQEENRLREKIHVLKLTIQKIESYLKHMNANTPS